MVTAVFVLTLWGIALNAFTGLLRYVLLSPPLYRGANRPSEDKYLAPGSMARTGWSSDSDLVEIAVGLWRLCPQDQHCCTCLLPPPCPALPWARLQWFCRHEPPWSPAGALLVLAPASLSQAAQNVCQGVPRSIPWNYVCPWVLATSFTPKQKVFLRAGHTSNCSRVLCWHLLIDVHHGAGVLSTSSLPGLLQRPRKWTLSLQSCLFPSLSFPTARCFYNKFNCHSLV